LTAKEELFAKKIALENLNQTAAYSAAYDVSKMAPKTITDRGHDLAKKPDVAARITVLRERATNAAVEKAALTLADCITEAGEMLEDAKALGQVSAGVAAVKLRAQLAGHLTEKESKSKGPLDDLDISGLVELRQQLDAKLIRNRDALELIGDLPAPAQAQPVRRAIG
jgi:hypothetical protein